jgi:hypothetical protein
LIRQLRYEGRRLDDVLERVRADHGEHANIVSADLVRTGGIGGFFARECFRVVVQLDDQSDDEGATPPSPRVEPQPMLRGSGTDFADMLGQMIDLSYAEADVVETTAEPDRSPPVRATVPAETGAPLPLAEMLGRIDDCLRPAPPLPREGLVTVVGRRSEVGAAAATIAGLCGVPLSEVLLAAADHDLVTPERVARLASSLARRSDHRVTVVAVVIDGGLDGCRWAAEVVAALRADQVRLAVGGWRRSGDAADLLGLLSAAGPVAAVDLVGAADAAEPDAFLALDVPIGTVDGQIADLDRWLELVVDARRHAAGSQRASGEVSGLRAGGR